MELKQATHADYKKLQDIEDRSFGVHIIEKEFQLIVNEGFGEIFFAYEKEIIVGYIAVLFKEYNKKVENILQPLLSDAKKRGERIMHDDVHFDENKYVYFHLVGIDTNFHNKGVGSTLTQFMYDRIKQTFPNKQIKVCIRINNLPSIRMCMKELKTCMTSLKPNNWNIIGSVESNFNATTSDSYTPRLQPPQKQLKTYITLQEMPSKSEFLIPVKYGEERDLKQDNPDIFAKLEKIFDAEYIITGLFKATELGLTGESYFLCEKR